MSKIVKKKYLHPSIVMMEVEDARIAKKALPGHFVMIRADQHGERFPLTIASANSVDNTITIIFQIIGVSTMKLNDLDVNDYVIDIVGPLGNPVALEDVKRVIVIGGGVGCAIAFPHAKSLFEKGVKVDFIAGFRNKDFVFLKDEIEEVSCQFVITTDDGSGYRHGVVTDVLKEWLSENSVDAVIAIGPLKMMKAVAELTRPYQVLTIVSLNPIMIDGTGMCGGCRVKIGTEYKFACVDGPEFDGHLVDFDELILRNQSYRDHEEVQCRLYQQEKNHDSK